MRVSVETTSGLERRMEVEVPAAQIEAAVEARLREVGRTARLQGFRPGKVPPNVVRQRFGSQIHQEVVEELVKRSFAEAVIDKKLNPAGGPRIEPLNALAGQDLKYTATFEVYPQIELKGLDSLEIDRPVVEVTAADVDGMVEHLHKQWASWKAGQNAAALSEATASDQDEGTESSPEVAGTPAESPPAAEEPVALPPMDEEFCRAFGVQEGGLEELRRQVEQNMRREVEQGTRWRMREDLFKALLAANEVQLPAALVDSTVSDMQVDWGRRAGVYEVEKIPGREKFEPAAKRRVTLGLLLGELVQREALKPDPAKVEERLRAAVVSAHDSHAHSHGSPEEHQQHLQEMLRAYRRDPQAMRQIESMVVEEQAVDWLLAKAKQVDKPQSFKDFSQFGEEQT